MKTLLLLSLGLTTSCAYLKPKSKTESPNLCHASREYITTLEFIRDQKDFSLNETQARELANKVSGGCTGASKRFIQVTKLLLKSGMPSQVAIDTGLKYAVGEEASYLAFMTIFKSSYLESLLDLDLKLSLELALDLTQNYKGDKTLIEKEFSQLVDFCVNRKSLELPLIDCAKTSARVIKSGEGFDFKISKDFTDVFSYVTDKNKANLPTFEALKIAESVVAHGPQAKENFFKGYEYAVEKKGLDQSIKEALTFGKLMASRSVKKDI